MDCLFVEFLILFWVTTYVVGFWIGQSVEQVIYGVLLWGALILVQNGNHSEMHPLLYVTFVQSNKNKDIQVEQQSIFPGWVVLFLADWFLLASSNQKLKEPGSHLLTVQEACFQLLLIFSRGRLSLFTPAQFQVVVCLLLHLFRLCAFGGRRAI